MLPTRWGCDGRKVRVYLAGVFLVVFAGGLGAAQFRLPKIPKLGKTQPAEQKKPAAAPAAELTALSLHSASPGAEGDLVLTGKNFNAGTGLRMNCPNAAPAISNFKVESPTRAVAHVRFPFNTAEGPCEIYLEQRDLVTGAGGEITASRSGTVLVTLVPSVSFNISTPSEMPMVLPVAYVGEGEMEFTQVMMKMQEALHGSWGGSGQAQLLVVQGRVTFKQGEQTVFDEPASNVKEVGEMAMMGEKTGVFRLVMNGGKIYNFIEKTDGGLPKGKTVEILKTALKK